MSKYKTKICNSDNEKKKKTQVENKINKKRFEYMIHNVGGGELVESNIVWSFMLSHVGSQNQKGT